MPRKCLSGVGCTAVGCGGTGNQKSEIRNQKSAKQMNQLNQQAQRLLNQARNQARAAEALGDVRRVAPAVELMRWAVASGAVELEPRYAGALLAAVEGLAGQEPDRAAEYLSQSADREQVASLAPEEFGQIQDPAEAAALLFQELHTTLGATMPAYHSPVS